MRHKNEDIGAEMSTATEVEFMQQEASARMDMYIRAVEVGIIHPINYIKPPRKHVESRIVGPKQLPAGKESHGK